VVDGVRIADGEAALGTLVDPAFDPQREVVLPAGVARPAGEGPAGTATLQRLESDSVEVAADVRRDGRLVLVDAYDPGWRADVDGRPVEIERANVAFRAVAVPPGRHVVTFRYRPRAVGVGLAVSALALVAVAVLLRGPLRGREPC
ncbi:MAG TPA: YfhO family protein, partial [Vicinamibacteria bacterium]|nr:YfhO family protein [Vicinamibacteria bacterium]